MRGFTDRDQRSTSSNEGERATMSSWRFGHISTEDAIEQIGGTERFKELLTPRERRLMKEGKGK